MQVPEKLSLIGGSILLASTLVFTLKSQASDILPKVDSGMSSLMKTDQERQQDQQKQQQDQTFSNNFQQAQQRGWQTGQWGTAKFYVDDQGNMHVGSGQLSSPVFNNNQVDYNKIKTINLDAPVQAPQDSSYLFSTNDINKQPKSLQSINGMNQLDTSNTTNMHAIFFKDSSLSNLDLSHFNTSNVTDMFSMFERDNSLSNVNLSHFNTHNVNNMGYMFEEDSSLSNLDVSHFDTSSVSNMVDMFEDDNSLSHLDMSHFDTHNVNYMEYMFDEDNIHQLSLGPNTQFQNSGSNSASLSGTYQSNGQTLNVDGNAHPGTWIKQ